MTTKSIFACQKPCLHYFQCKCYKIELRQAIGDPSHFFLFYADRFTIIIDSSFGLFLLPSQTSKLEHSLPLRPFVQLLVQQAISKHEKKFSSNSTFQSVHNIDHCNHLIQNRLQFSISSISKIKSILAQFLIYHAKTIQFM